MRRLWIVAVIAVAGIGVVGSSVAAVEGLPQIVMNEIELNPPGRDAGAEWIEILNLGEETIDLAGWTLTYNYRVEGQVTISEESLEIAPGERYIFVYPQLMLRNAEGTVFELRDPTGIIVDRTAPLKDEDDDGQTWQRYPDGGDPLFLDFWVFGDGTRGKPNE